MSMNLSVVGRIRGLSLTAVVVMIAAFLMSSALPGELSAADGGVRPEYSVDVSGDLAVVGASWENGYSGAAYVLRKDGDSWAVEQRLVPSDLGRFDHFGGTVSIDGDRITVTSPWHDLQRGASYVFRKDGDAWVQDRKIPAGKEAVAGKLAENMLLSGGPPEQDALPAGALDLIDALESETGGTPPLMAPAALEEPEWVSATNGVFEDRVEITWKNTGQDGILYKVFRGDILLAFVTSDLSSYSDETVTIGVTAQYCVTVTDMVSEETTPVCDPDGGGTRIIFKPTSFTASDGQYTDGVHLSWVDISSINDGYHIYRDGNSVPIGSTGENETSYIDDTADPGWEYTYKVTAYVDGGYESEPDSASGLRGELLPPLNVSASDGQYLGKVVVTWLDQDPNATGYIISGGSTPDVTIAAGVQIYEDDSVVFGRSYVYCVTAIDEFGGVSSIDICDDGIAGLAAPGNVSASDSTFDDRVRITWEDRSEFEDGYEIARDVYVAGGTTKNDTRPIVTASAASVTLGTVGADEESFDDMTAEPGVIYVYNVHAFSLEGGVSPTGENTGSRSVVLAPTDVLASDGEYEDRTYVSWESASTTATGFIIFRDGILIKSVEESRKYYNDTGGVAGKEYDYSVKAVTLMGATSAGVWDAGYRELLNPAPVSAGDNAFEDRVVINWADNSAVEDGYRIYRRAAGEPGTLLGDFNTTGTAKDVAVSGNYAYVVDDSSGLHVIDISDPAAPDSVGSYDTPSRAMGVAVSGEYAYVADWHSGLQIIDISDPTTPLSVGSYNTPQTAIDVAISGDFAYVADYGRLLVIDISDPTTPELAGSYDTPGQAYYAVAISGDYAYVADADDGLQVIDISDPATPRLVGSYDTPGRAFGVAVSGDYAYVADHSEGLQIIDISTPTAPRFVESYDTPSYSFGIAVSGDRAYLADYSSGIQVVDISDPTTPSSVCSYDTPGSALDIAISGSIACVADGSSGLQVIGINGELIATTDPNRTSFVDYLGTSAVDYVYSVAAYDMVSDGTAGESAAASDEGGRLLIPPTSVTATDGTYEDRVEITWNDNSNSEDGYYIYRDADEIGSTADNYTTFTDYSAVLRTQHIYSVAAFDAIGPSEAAVDGGSIDILATASLNASDTYPDRIELSWIDQSDIEDGYNVYRREAGSADYELLESLAGDDITSYSDLYLGPPGTVWGRFDGLGEYAGIAVADGYAYIADYESGLRIIDINNPSTPGLVGSYEIPSAYYQDIAVSGDYAYLAAGTNGLQIVDISNPANPTHVGDYLHTGFRDSEGVAVAGNYAYLADVEHGLQVIDISTPSTPTLVGSSGEFEVQEARSVAVAGNYAYVVGIVELYVYDISTPSSPTLLGTLTVGMDCADIAIAGKYVYVPTSGMPYGLRVIDISTPTNPVLEVNHVLPGNAYAVTISGNVAYVAGVNAPSVTGIQAIDISDPSDPFLRDSYETPGNPYDLVVAGNYAYVTEGDSGLTVLLVNPYPGIIYDYCARAYKGDAESGESCDTGIIPTDSGTEITNLSIELLASDPNSGDAFGYSVSISGDRAIIGSWHDDENGSSSNAGAIYFFERDAEGIWGNEQKLLADDYDEPFYVDDEFGASVSISGDWAIVGAPGDDIPGDFEARPDKGAVYFFKRDAGGTWAQMQKLRQDDTHTAYGGDEFGGSVSINGNRAIGGAINEAANGSNAGAVYVFELVGGVWGQTHELFPADGSAGQRFGNSVSISGDRIIVGAKYDSENENYSSGAAYIFELDAGGGTWTQMPKLLASDSDGVYASDNFGVSVAISGDRAVIGAENDDESGSNAGAAYLFERDAGGVWAQAQKFLASDSDAIYVNDRFGRSVSIDGDRFVVGASSDDENGGGAGAAYLFERAVGGAWTQAQKLLAGPGNTYSGSSVSTSGDRVIVGAYGGAYGSAYILDETFTVIDVVAATDGTQDSRIRVTWTDDYSTESGFLIYRDGSLYIDNIAPNVEYFNDTDALRGRTYEYCVKAVFAAGDPIDIGCDFGWRPPNGGVAGRVTTRGGAGVKDIPVFLDPPLTGAILCDGVAGYIRIGEADLFNFDTSNDFTVEAWVRYSGSGGTDGADNSIISKADASPNFPFVLHTGGGDGHPGRLVFEISDGILPVSVESSDALALNDNNWHHVACVYNGEFKELNLFIDGELNGSISATGLGDITNDDDLFFGSGRPRHFRGQIDEIRIWTTARTSVELNSSMALQLNGDEPFLVGYWPFDEGEGPAVTDFAGTAQYGILSKGVYWTDDAAPLDISAKTDIEGNYVHTGLKFKDGGNLSVRPSEGERQFQPAFKTVVLSEQSPSVNEISFVEISSYTVSGEILFAGTGCPAVGAMVLLDGNAAGVTDKNGKFAISADNGEHTLAAQLDGHTFLPADTILFMDSNKTADFTDMTLHTLSGTVGGGCGRYVGDVTITFESRDGCMSKDMLGDFATASYSISLPPQVYYVSASVVPDPEGELDEQEVIDFFSDLGVREVDLSAVTDTLLDFIYRAPLVVTIEGFDDYVPACTQLSVSGDTLPSGLPVIEQFEYVTLQIKVNEDYGTGGACPLDTGTVMIYDEIFDRVDSPVSVPVSNGIAEYTTFASTPSLISGRVVEEVNRSYQKSITAHAHAEGKSADPVTEWALVTGHVAQEGFEFITFTGSVQPQYILRDPPGDNSFSYLEEGYTSCTNLKLGGSFTTGSGIELNIAWGVDKEFFIGLGAGTSEKLKIQQTDDLKTTASQTVSADFSTETCLAFSDRFSTSSSDLFTGARGDVFIGAGTNYIFAEVSVIDIEGCNVVRSTSTGVQPEGFHTTFAYTKQYIEDVLIPEMERKEAYYIEAEEPDSAEIYQDARDDWLRMLAMNAELKQSSELSENRSFSAGAEYQYTHSSTTTLSYGGTLTLRIGSEWDHGFKTKLFGQDQKLIVSSFMSAETSIGAGGSNTSTETVGYLLSDDDIGDNFTVDVKYDKTYPSPVFDVLAGVSSCPWEAWPDTSGAARMVPRDEALMQMDSYMMVNVPADEPAVFQLDLSNNSQSRETREYHMKLLSTSNPDGAALKVNGALINGPQSFFLEPALDGAAPTRLTLTVDRGPVSYTYDSLKVFMYSPCEYANWGNGGVLQKADTVTFSVHFEAPCSEITLSSPVDGWTYDKAMETASTPISIRLSAYERDFGGSGDDQSIQFAGARYRRSGSGAVGPGEWNDCEVIKYVDLPEDNVTIEWLPPESLADGIYEIRAFTHCIEGEGYSKSAIGTIDRNAPVVFGTPEPTDGVLSSGEDISVTFSEEIDCESIDEGDITLTYLDGPSVGQPIDFDSVCAGSSILIIPTGDTGDLESRQIEVRVSGITDLIGYPLEEPAVWTFEYRKSQFAWSDDYIVAEGALNTPDTLLAEMVNGTGQAVNFDFAPLPTLIAEVIPESGKILPGEKQVVELVIQTGLTVGNYIDEITANGGSSGVAVLTIDLTIACQTPAWAVNPSRFEHSMTVVAELDIGGISEDGMDMLAAFIGGELRGVASIDTVQVNTTDRYLAFMTVYSNRPSGETVRFQVWDDSDCKLFKATDQSPPFVADSQFGTPDLPEMIVATEVLGSDVLEIVVHEGWNWISTNIKTPDMSVTNVLADLILASGDLIKSQTAFSQYIDNSAPDSYPEWVPVFELDNVSGYLLNLSQAGTIIHTGAPVSVDSIIPVSQGWNWISYLPIGPETVDAALDDLDVDGQDLLTDDDIIKGQDGFAQYVGGEWYGTLTEMEPGRGYKLSLANAGVTGFNYQEPSGSPPVAVAAAEAGEEAPEAEAVAEGEQTVAAPDWAVNPYAYQFNMTMTAVLRVDGLESVDGRDVIGAFVDGECRGLASPEYIGGLRRYEVFLMIHSNEPSGESVEFRVFDADEGTICGVTEQVDCAADAVLGTVTQPFVLSAVSGEEEQDGGVPKAYALGQNVPNPFNPSTTVYYDVPAGGGNVSLRIYDVSGRLVRTLVDGHDTEGSKSVTWDGTGDRGTSVASGIYFYRMSAPGFTETKKMVLLR